MSVVEANFDGLVGPTHNYAGLSFGNVASILNKNERSSPKKAALQGLKKMKALADLGIAQAVIPPQERPLFSTLRQLGYEGSLEEVLAKASKTSPELLTNCFSASSMWCANMATVSPSKDSQDGKVHFTPANLLSTFHRSLECSLSAKLLQKIFPSPRHFVHHAPLPAHPLFCDEGAANHTRLSPRYSERGLHLFTYGKSVESDEARKYPARQTLEASEAVARQHGLLSKNVLFLRQNKEAIDAGVFHNDVIAVGNQNVLICHEKAFAEGLADIEKIKATYESLFGEHLNVFIISEKDLPLKEAVSSYLFNSQLVTLPSQKMALIAPTECEQNPFAKAVLKKLLSGSSKIDSLHFFDLRESMKNGGGPACLRLRVVLTEEEMAAVHPGVWLTDSLYDNLTDWVSTFYRDVLDPATLFDPELTQESKLALTVLYKVLGFD